MPKKRAEDLLGPIGEDPGADYIRARLKRRVELERGITMRRRQVEALLRCLDKAATLGRIRGLHDEVLAETASPTWGLEVEPLLVEVHGAWRYEGRPEVMVVDMERAARHYAIGHAMDALLAECRFPLVRTRGERLDDAAWYAVPERDRG
jgi:hypothetical protein